MTTLKCACPLLHSYEIVPHQSHWIGSENLIVNATRITKHFSFSLLLGNQFHLFFLYFLKHQFFFLESYHVSLGIRQICVLMSSSEFRHLQNGKCCSVDESQISSSATQKWRYAANEREKKMNIHWNENCMFIFWFCGASFSVFVYFAAKR